VTFDGRHRTRAAEVRGGAAGFIKGSGKRLPRLQWRTTEKQLRFELKMSYFRLNAPHHLPVILSVVET